MALRRSGNGIYLNNTPDVQLADMQLNDFQNYGISGTNVTDFTLDHTVINGTNGTLQGGIGEGDVYFTGLSGSASVTNSSFTGAAYDAFHVFNDTAQTLNRLTITGSTFATQSGARQRVQRRDRVRGERRHVQRHGAKLDRSPPRAATCSSSTCSAPCRPTWNSAALPRGSAIPLTNTNQNIVSGGGGITIGGGGAANNVTLTYDVSHNAINGAAWRPASGHQGHRHQRLVHRHDRQQHDRHARAWPAAARRRASVSTSVQDGAGVSSTTITNNHVSGTAAAHDAAPQRRCRRDDCGDPGQHDRYARFRRTPFAGIYAQTGSATGAGGDNNKSNITLGGAGALKNSVDLGGNVNAGLVAGIFLEQEGVSEVGLIGSPNYAGAPYDLAAVASYVASNNTVTNVGSTGAVAVQAIHDPSSPAGGGYFGGAQFLVATSGGVRPPRQRRAKPI